MLVTINNSTSVADIQDHFSTCFPHLRIEFYENHNALKKNVPMLPSILLAEVRHTKTIGQIEIKSWDSATKVIGLFKNNFGLLVRIFRSKNGLEFELGPHEQVGAAWVEQPK